MADPAVNCYALADGHGQRWGMSVLRCRPGDLVLVTCGEKNASKVTTCAGLGRGAAGCGHHQSPTVPGAARRSTLRLGTQEPASCFGLSGLLRSRLRPDAYQARTTAGRGTSADQPSTRRRSRPTAPLAVSPFLRRRSRRLRHESARPEDVAVRCVEIGICPKGVG
jgi:hypothetical protein